MPNRRRLSPDERRDELLDVGATLFSQRPYDEVSMDDVAAEAHVSRALMYHYFATKGEFFGAIWKRAHDRLLAAVALDPAATVRDGVEATLAAHLDFYEEHIPLVFVANRSAISSDPAVRGPVAEDLAAICDRILEACSATGRERDVASAALSGWIAFIREVCIEWLLHQRVSRTDVLRLSMSVLDTTVGVTLDLEAAPA